MCGIPVGGDGLSGTLEWHFFVGFLWFYRVFDWGKHLAVLDEANVVGLLAEALTADVKAVLADQTGTVSADAAVMLAEVQLIERLYAVCCARSEVSS